MKTIVYRAGLLIAGCALLAACSSSTPPEHGTATAATQLFTLEPTPDRNTLQKNATGYLATLLADPVNTEITMVNATPEAISNTTQALTVRLPNGNTAQFDLRNFTTLAEGYDGWVGYKPSEWKRERPSPTEIGFDPDYYLSIIRHGDQLIGNLTVAGEHYQLVNIGNKKHALIKLDESKLPPEAEPVLEAQPDQQNALKAASKPTKTHSTIRMLFVTTTQARAKNPNFEAALILGLQDVNEITKNSQVDINYELAGFVNADYDETGKSFADLLNAVTYYMPEVTRKRDELHADLVSMLVKNGEYCGAGKPGPAKKYGFSAINCISSLAHEIGHNFGMYHQWTGSSTGYNYGYRYRPETGTLRFRTQMAYECSPACPKKPFYSNPRLTYQGQPLGTAAHEDVSRALNDRRETVENFYPPFRGLALTVYEQANFQGRSCLIVIPHGNAANVASECANQPVRSFRVNGYEAGAKICLYDGAGARHVCYAGNTNAKRDFEVSNIDQSQTVPPEFRRTQKGGVLNGAVVDALYGRNAVLLFAEADFKKPLCSFGLNYKEYVVAEQPGCATDTGGKARSARIFSDDTEGTAHSQWCFFNSNKSRTLCLKGRYWGAFGVANFDSTRGIPSELKRTQTGGYMNGSVFRFKYDTVSSQ